MVSRPISDCRSRGLDFDSRLYRSNFSGSIGSWLGSSQSFFLSFFLHVFILPNVGLSPPGTYNPNARGSDACRGSNSLWTRTLDRYTRAGLPQCVVSTISGPPPKTTWDTHPIPGQKLKFLTPPGTEPGPPDWKAGTLLTTPWQRMCFECTIRHRGWVEGWDVMKVVKNASRPLLAHHHRGWCNYMKQMRWVWRNHGMKFVAGETPRKIYSDHETHMQWPRCELGTPAMGDACAMSPHHLIKIVRTVFWENQNFKFVSYVNYP